MEENKYGNKLGSHGLREDRLLKAFRIGASATSELKPGLALAGSAIEVDKASTTFSDSEVADKALEDPASS